MNGVSAREWKRRYAAYLNEYGAMRLDLAEDAAADAYEQAASRTWESPEDCAARELSQWREACHV